MLRLLRTLLPLSSPAFAELKPLAFSHVAASVAEKQAPGAGEAISGVTGRVGQLVDLLNKLGADFDAEFQEAQAAYDKQSVANEDTIKKAEKDIADSEKRIEELNEAIEKGTADIGRVDIGTKVWLCGVFL